MSVSISWASSRGIGRLLHCYSVPLNFDAVKLESDASAGLYLSLVLIRIHILLQWIVHSHDAYVRYHCPR